MVALVCTGLMVRPAAADDDGGIYVGADVGYLLDTYRRADIDNAIVGSFDDAFQTLTLTRAYTRERQTPAAIDVGYRFLTYFGVEASYLTLGTLEYASRGKASTLSGSGPAEIDFSFKSRGPTLALVGALPMTSAWSLTARLGAYEGKTLTHFASDIEGVGTHGLDSKTTASLLAGVGTQYVVGAHWVLRLDYTHLNQLGESVLNKSFNVDLVTAGVNYVF